MTPRPMESRNPDARAMRADPAPVVAEKPPSPWQAHTLWLADPSAAPVEYLNPLRELGFTQLCVRAVHGESPLPVIDQIADYEQHGWNVVAWGRVDQMLGSDTPSDPKKAAGQVARMSMLRPFAANVEIRWQEGDNAVYASLVAHKSDALCTYPGGIADGAHRYYQQAGVRVCLVQTFSETEPWGIGLTTAQTWGKGRGYEISIPMVGCFKGTSGYADAAAQGAALRYCAAPVHAYLVEQSGWRHMSGQGYDFEALMRGVR